MEVEDLHQTQQPPCKFSRIGNGRNDTSKIGTVNGIGGDHNHHHHRQFQEDAEEDGEIKMSLCNPAIGGAVVAADGPNSATTNRLRGWHHSRIIRVSRASGGKDRHSKVWTSKGLRDRRVRLSVTTAIQFYDLQDRLGYDQPSKAVEWLIKAAADAISELPSLNASFLDIPKQFADEKRGDGTAAGEEQGFDSPDLELEDDQEPGDGSYNPNQNQNQNQNHQQLSLSKSASETSKGSGLSLSRSDVRVSRVKARERAREKAAAAKEKENAHHQQNLNTMSQNSTFTELLTGGIGGGIGNNNNKNNSNNTTSTPATTSSSPSGSEVNLFHKATTASSWPLTAMDYFGPGLLGPPSSSRNNTQHHHPSSAAILGQIHSIPQAMTSTTMSMSVPQFNLSSGGETTHSHGHHHHHHHHPHHHNQEQHLQHFPFVSDYLMPVATSTQGGGPGVDYNLNFTISSSSGLAGFNRGTLQSNSSPPSQTTTSLLPQQPRRFSSPIDGSSATHLPFFMGGSAPPLENHNHLFPSGLQLCYGDGSSSRHSDQKGKGKNN